ncbi:target of Nesh-SH3 [Crotalus adamanteus]|uniref:Target of Nesh-SH3 n=1 Tax=Crotalus adamanteus TaxID=8729 RepID=A0AAW1BKL6_CROAD
MISRLVFLLFCGHFAQILGNAGKLPRVKKQSLKVQINVTNDAVCMRYIHPTPSTKLEGFILGYGSSFFSNQYIPLPSNGKMYITEVDAEPRYLIVVRPAPVPNNKKSCSGKTKKPKPLQLVIGTLTPTSVFLSWGILVNPKHDWTTMNNCPNDRFYTVRYREKDKSKKWILQLCPSTETVVDNLKPNTIYEFGVKDNIDDGIWSKSFIHKVVIPGKNKENGQLQNNYKFPKIHTQFIPDSKTLVPVKVIKQVLQNITHRTQSEILQRPPLSGPILVHLIIPDFNATKQKPPSSSRFDIFEKPKQILAKNKTQEWLPESKISEVKEITPKSQIDLEKSKSTAAGVSKDSTVSQAHTESELESSTPSKAPMTEMPPVTLDLRKFLGIPKARPSPTPHMPTESSVLKKMQPVPSESETPVLKTIQTKAAVTDEPTLESFPYKTSKTLAWPRATLVSTLPSLKQNIPKISRITEKLKASPEKESQEKTTASSIFKTPELPRTTMAVTNKLIPLPGATKISVTDGHPVATMASKEINPVPSKSKEFDYTKPEEPDRKLASYKPSPVPPRFKEPVYIMPEVPDRKHVSTEDDHYLPKVLTTPELPITKSVSYESSPVPSKFKESGYILPEVPDKKPVSADYDNCLLKVFTTPELQITKHASYKPSPVPPKFKEPESIMPEVPDRKHVSTEEENYLPKVLTTTERPITKPASYEESSVPSKFKEPGYIMLEEPDRKAASYKPSLIPPKFKEPDYGMPEVPDRKHVSTEDDNYLPKLLTTTKLSITKHVSTEDDNYLPKVLTTPEPPITKSVSTEDDNYLPKVLTMPEFPITKPVSTEDDNYLPKVLTTPELLITKPASYKSSPIPPKFKEPEYTMPEVPDRKHVSYEPTSIPSNIKEPDYILPEVPERKHASYKQSSVPSTFQEPRYIPPEVQDTKHVSTEDDNYLPNVLTTTELPITKPVSTEDDNYLPKILTTTERPITKPVSTEDDNYLPKVLTTPELIITESEPESIMPEVPDRKHVSTEDDNYLPKVFTTPELLITESVSTEDDNYLPKVLTTTKHPITKPVSTEDDNYLPKILTTTERPITKPVSYKPSPVPSTFKEPSYITPEVPDTKYASYKPSPVLPKFKEPEYMMPEVPDRKHVSTEEYNYLPKVLSTTERPITKPVSTEDDNYLPKILTRTELPITKPASYESIPAPSKFKEPDSILSEVPDKKHVLEPITFSNELPIVDAKTKHHISITKTTINPLLLPKSDVEEVIFKTEQAKSSTAPKETHQVPTRPKTSSSPDITPTKSSLNVKHHDPSKPKSPPGQKAQQSKPDPKETRLLPSKPKPSDKQEKNKTKPGSSKLNNKVTVTKTPHLKKVVHRTTPAPPRTRTPGGPSWSKKPRGEKLTNEDVAKPLHPSSSTKSSIPIDSTVVRKKPDPVATLPGSPRPPLAPARPTPIRRKPLPPNNVTGKPGRSGNVLMPRASSILTTSIAKPTWPSSLVKTNSPKKLPTAAASPDYNNPMFSSIPTSDTDIAGTPRYTGDHVKYLKKKDDEPCSITDTIQHFPSDMEDNSDMATSAPQKPPTNLTVVTVEGCPSFVVLDWKKPENETVTEYKVVSTENGGTVGKDKSIITTNQTHSTVENLKPNTSYEFVVIPSNPLGEGPSSESKPFRTESADPRVTESISMGKDAIWTEVSFNSDDYSECKGKQYVKRTWYKKFVGVQLCNSLRYKIYLSDTLTGTFYNIGDQRGHGEDHCQFVDSYFDGKTGQMLPSDQLPTKDGYFRAVRQEPVHFGKIGAGTHSTYVNWYECGTTIPGKW